MKLILSSHDKECADEVIVGGKAKNLSHLQSSGVNTPWFICLPTPSFFNFIKQFSKNDLKQMPHEQIEKLFLNAQLGEDIERELEKLLHEKIQEGTSFAVRSSATGEDSSDNSFAGQFSSYLNQKNLEDIKKSIKQCWASFYNDRATHYRRERNIESVNLGMAVIVQKMISADISGVAFTRDPIHPTKTDQMIISSVYGVGEGLVSGELDSDNFYIDRKDLSFTKEIAKKDFAFYSNPKGGLQKVGIDLVKQSVESLTSDQVSLIAKSIIKIEESYAAAQDIEWCISNGELYFVQSRPITNLPSLSFFNTKIKGGQYILWDNSNITESYSGVTTPLTFSHISKAYRQVYVQFCEVMGVPSEVIREHEKTFRNMLGLVRGRVFYNLKNWYHMIFLFPFSATSNGFMETMMGVKQDLKPEIASLFDFMNNPPKYTTQRKLYILGLNLWRILRVRKIIEEFKSDFEKSYSVAKKIDYSTYSLQALLDEYDKLNEDLLFKWKAPIISDTRCMVFFGVLKSLTEKWLNQGPSNLYNDLLTGIEDLPSTAPTKLLMGISQKIKQQGSGAVEFFLANTTSDILTALNNGQFPEVKKDFDQYIDQFGFRCMNELKLESVDLHEDPTMAMEAILGFLRNKKLNVEDMHKNESAKYNEALIVIEQNLKGIKKNIYFFFLKKARLAVKDREDLRLLRTNIFGICRRIFKAIGQRYKDLGLLEDSMDVFYLSIDEIIAYQEGRSFEVELKSISELRKKQFEQYRKSASPPDRFYTEGTAALNFQYPQVLMDYDLLVSLNKESDDPSILLGTPCSPGVIEGVVRVVKEIEDAKGLNGEIMVCERTDPGWVPLFPSTSGLLIERGSLLSHSAIVARELGIPTIVGITGGVMKKLKTGMRVRVDAGKGEIKILD